MMIERTRDIDYEPIKNIDCHCFLSILYFFSFFMTTRTTELSRDLLSTIRVSKIFQDSDGPITSLSFNDSGVTCLTTAEDDSLRVYDALEGS